MDMILKRRAELYQGEIREKRKERREKREEKCALSILNRRRGEQAGMLIEM